VFVTWTKTTGNHFIFGGGGIDSGGIISYLNDLWEFCPFSRALSTDGRSSSTPAANNCQPRVPESTALDYTQIVGVKVG
jgi:hypothetical protein